MMVEQRKTPLKQIRGQRRAASADEEETGVNYVPMAELHWTATG